MARRRRCDVMCPVSTAIFIRIAAQAAVEEIDAGKPVDSITPFWQIFRPEDKITKRLDIDLEWIAVQREKEAVK